MYTCSMRSELLIPWHVMKQWGETPCHDNCNNHLANAFCRNCWCSIVLVLCWSILCCLNSVWVMYALWHILLILHMLKILDDACVWFEASGPSTRKEYRAVQYSTAQWEHRWGFKWTVGSRIQKSHKTKLTWISANLHIYKTIKTERIMSWAGVVGYIYLVKVAYLLML